MLRFVTCMLLFSFLISCRKENVLTEKTLALPSVPAVVFNVNKAVMLDLINKARLTGCNCGTTVMPPVNPVTWNNQLSQAAYDHSKDMLAQNYFSHTAKNGSDPGTRITNAGYIWRAYGENIAFGYTGEQTVMEGWLNSEGHCKNIMNASFKEIGAGREGNYWTQEFGSK